MVSRFIGRLFFAVIFTCAGTSRLFAGDDSQAAMANIFVNLAKKMVPSVVNVFTTSAVKTPFRGQGDPSNDIWRRFFEEYFGGGDPYGGAPDRALPGGRVQALGTGFIIEVNNDVALILTNNHVVEDADGVKVKFTESSDEKASPAEIVGRDADLDVALLSVKTTSRKLLAVTLGDSDKLEQGEWVMAVGNPFGHGHSVAKGIISAKERTLPGSYSQYLQVDAPINPGNSGGPLANLQGDVVGMNNAVLANAQGIGFAIPINLVKKILPQLKTKGHVERGYIGINIEDLRPSIAKNLKVDEDLHAPVVTNIIKNGPADKAGIKSYDVILEIADKRVKDTIELVNTITSAAIGSKVRLKILRQGKERNIDVSVDKRPTEPVDHQSRKGQHLRKGIKQERHVDTGMEIEALTTELKNELGLPESVNGVVVVQVALSTPADEAGLRRGDVILEVERKSVRSVEEFYKIVKDEKIYLLRVRRQDEQGDEGFAVITLNLTGEPSPEED